MTFKTAMDENTSLVFLNEDHFGELFSFRPHDGPARDVVGLPIEETAEEGDSRETQTEQDVLWVLVLRDAANIAKGGIAAIADGDALFRSGDPVPWTFQGRIRNEAPASWELCFARNRPKRYGK